MKIPQNVISILEAINKNGHEAYIVGGCVRDYIMGLEPSDWDITTSAEPSRIKQLFSHTVDTGIKHGTVTVILNGCHYEVTTYRIDGEYLNFRQPERVYFTKNLEDDLKRRDFTMNAIAFHPEAGFSDPFDGITDIKNKTIRGVCDPDTRFNEDALRMLRAVRFAAQLDFEIEPLTYAAVKKNCGLIENISIERIRDELLKLLLSNAPEKLAILVETGLSRFFLPDLEASILNETVQKCLKASEKDLTLRLCALFSQIGLNQAGDILKRIRLPNKTIIDVLAILKFLNEPLPKTGYEVKKILSLIGQGRFIPLMGLKRCFFEVCGEFDRASEVDNIISGLYKPVIERGECFSLKKLAVNGNDITPLGLPKNRTGQILNMLLDSVMRGEAENNAESLMNFLNNSDLQRFFL